MLKMLRASICTCKVERRQEEDHRGLVLSQPGKLQASERLYLRKKIVGAPSRLRVPKTAHGKGEILGAGL